FAALVSKLGRLVRQRAQGALDEGDVRLAGAMLERLAQVDGQCVETQRLREAVAQCRLAWGHVDRCQPRQAEEVIRRVAPPLPGEALPPRFVLQVDGAGSYLIVTQPRVTLGPISSSRQPDVALMTEATASFATVERVEDDYFIRAAGPMMVNGRACPSKLLAAGDEIALSPRCRL